MDIHEQWPSLEETRSEVPPTARPTAHSLEPDPAVSTASLSEALLNGFAGKADHGTVRSRST